MRKSKTLDKNRNIMYNTNIRKRSIRMSGFPMVLFREFGVNSEKELAEKLNTDWEMLPCVECGREAKLDQIIFIDGDPYCLCCGRGQDCD
jgi:hypothetical protein